MAIYNKPDENVFASSARQGEVSNFPDIGRGWGVSFDQTGGIPPMEWFNFLFKRTDEKFGYLFQRGLSEWSETQTYPEGALVQYKNLTYKAKRANTNKNPEQANSLDWQRWGFTQSELKSATLTESGITQLLTSINSDDETKSATPKSVKMAYNKGVEAKSAADAAQFTANNGVSKANAAQTSANNANNNANGRVSKSGDRLTGILYSVGISSKHFGYGAYANQYTSGAPFLVNAEGSQDRDTYHPFVKGLVRSRGRYGAGFSFGYATKQGAGDGFGRGIIHLIEDNGSNKIWAFEHDGEFRSAGDVKTSSGKSLETAVQPRDFQYQKTGNFEIRRYPDGTMIQTCFVNVGENQLSTNQLKKFNWAVSFVDKPMVWATANATNNANGAQVDISALVGVVISDCTSSICAYRTGEIWQNTNHNPTMNFLAIGRWK